MNTIVQFADKKLEQKLKEITDHAQTEVWNYCLNHGIDQVLESPVIFEQEPSKN